MLFQGFRYAKIAFADPAGGAYSAPPDPLAGLKGPTSKGKGRGGEERRGEVAPPFSYSWIRPCRGTDPHYDFIYSKIEENTRKQR